MTRLLAIATALVVLLMTAQVNRAEAKGSGAHVLAAGPSGVFAATGDGLVHRIDPRNDRVAVSARVGGFPVALAPTPDTLWAVVAPPNRWPRVSRLAPDNLVARAQDVVGVGRPSMVAVGAETVWLARAPAAPGRGGRPRCRSRRSSGSSRCRS